VSLKLGFAGKDYGYAIDLGLPSPSASAFSRDPAIKCESVWTGETLGRSNAFAVRHGPSVRIRDDGGSWRQAYDRLASFDSMMTYCSDPGNGLELLLLRERLRDWRFYDHFRTDIEASPARRPQVGTYTPVLASDGADLAAAMQTIREIGDSAALDDAVADAFDGARIDVTGDRGYLELEMQQHGLLRSLKAAELSDGHAPLLALDFGAAVATPADPDDLERTRNEPPSGFARPAGAACCWCGVAIADFCCHPCWPARRFLVGGSRLPVICAWEGAWRDCDCGRRAPHLDLADEVIVPTARGERRTSSPFIRSKI
jgi:hypothetical protein